MNLVGRAWLGLAVVLGAQGDDAPPPPSRARSGDLAEILPREGRADLQGIEAGEMHLFALLQTLADSARMTVVYSGARKLADETIVLARPIPRPDRASVIQALSDAGLLATEEDYRGRKVLWILRELKPSGRAGAIRRPGEEPPKPVRVEPPGDLPIDDGPVRIFVQGEGRGATYLVLFETASRSEAEDARLLFTRYLEQSRSKKTEPSGAGEAKDKKGKPGRPGRER